MKIHNVRYGFATNSSSSHSIIILPEGASVSEESPDYGCGQFGWGNFTLASPGTKAHYLGVLIRDQLIHTLGEQRATEIARTLTGVSRILGEDYVDHQSVFTLPRGFGDSHINESFARDFINFVKSDRVAILGGNDNSCAHPLETRYTSISGLLDTYEQLIVRKDGDYYTLFNPAYGTKIRMSFDPNAKEPTYAKSPELVDIKITDFCDMDCSFCYQGSTPQGEHAPFERIQKLAFALAKHEVFEVAIGGGEPTRHPQFVEILEAFRSAGVVPNFTTRDLTWLKHSSDEQLKRIKAACGSFAYSVINDSEVDEFVELKTSRGFFQSTPLYLHVIPELLSAAMLKRILQKAKEHYLRVTLLGFKSTGRGGALAEKVKKSAEWAETIARLVADGNSPVVGIDTVMADTYGHALEDLDVPKVLYTTREGVFSMYIDAVSARAAPSSFCDEEFYVEFDTDTFVHILPDIFAGFR